MNSGPEILTAAVPFVPPCVRANILRTQLRLTGYNEQLDGRTKPNLFGRAFPPSSQASGVHHLVEGD